MREQSISKGFAILSVATLFSKVLSLLYVPILTRIIGDQAMGIYGKTYEVFVFVYALTNVGLQTAISKYVAELEAVGNYKDAVRAFKMSRTLLLLVGTVFTVVLILGADIIAKISGSPNMVYALVFLAPTVMITTVLVTYKGYFQGRNQATPIGIATILEQIVNVVLSLVCAYLLIKSTVGLGEDKNAAWGAAGGTVGTSVGALIAVIYLIYIYNIYGVEKEATANQVKGVKRASNKTIARTLFKYAVPITLSTGLQNFGNVVDMLTINNRLVEGVGLSVPDSEILYGYFSTRYKTLINVPMVFITSLGYMAMPAISRAYKIKDRREVKSKIRFSLRTVFLISIPSAFGLSVLAREIYGIIFPSTNGYLIATIGAFVLPFMAIVLIQNVILQSVNQFYYVLGILTFGIIIKVITNFILVGMPSVNIYGAVIATILSFLVSMILNHYRMKKTLKMKISMIKLIIKPLIASLYMSVGIIALRALLGMVLDLDNLNIVLSVPILIILIGFGGALYVHGIIYLGGVSKVDLEEISPKLLRIMPRFLKKHIK